MNRVHLSSELRQQLNGLNQRLEICDEHGRLVGYFVPYEDGSREPYDWMRAQITDQELETARLQTGGRTLAEIKSSRGLA